MRCRPAAAVFPLLLLAFPLAAAPADADRPPLTEAGELPRLQVRGDGETLVLPLEHTYVEAEVGGFAARVRVTQRFGNALETPVEAIYVFPLPENAAVDRMRIRVGDRVIEGEIRERQEARRVYEAARREGRTAALLEQERPNVFTQSLANLPPGEHVEVEISYVQTLVYDDGAYEFVFPMVVGPRYHPGQPTERPSTGSGTWPDTDRVPDASRVSPPVVPEGLRSAHDISLALRVEAGLPVRRFESPSHDLDAIVDDDTLEVRLAQHDRIPNRDFVLRWWVDGRRPQATVLAHRDRGDGTFALVVQPPRLDVDRLVGAREFVFVVDVSGSMNGLPLWLCQQAMREALSRLRPGDTFNVVTFAGRVGQAFEAPRKATEANVALAMGVVEGLRAGGGTEMRNAIDLALGRAPEPERHRHVFFLTDGYVGNELEIHTAARGYVRAHDREGRKARVFAVGVGSSPNRHLIEGLAQAGAGLADYLGNREDPAHAADRFFRVVDHPIVQDLVLDTGDLGGRLEDVYPTPLPDLIATRPLVVLGRYTDRVRGRLVLRGRTADGAEFVLPVDVVLPARAGSHDALETLWARARVHDLLASRWEPGHLGQASYAERVRAEVTRLGIAHRLVTPFTAFVAVDRSRTVGDGEPLTIVQPVEVPEDVDGAMAGAMPYGAPAAGSLAGRLHSTSPGGAPQPGIGGLGSRGAASGRMDVPLGVQLAAQAKSAVVPARGEPTVRGALDPAVVARVLDRHVHEARYCYDRARTPAAKPGEGEVVLKWTIDATGAVVRVEVERTTLGSPDVAACLAKRVRKWRFPRPGDGKVVEVTCAWRFEPMALPERTP